MGSACVYGGGRILTRPASSMISRRPSGRNSMLVGRSNPVASTWFWKKLVLLTLTATPAEVVVLPLASCALAVVLAAKSQAG